MLNVSIQKNPFGELQADTLSAESRFRLFRSAAVCLKRRGQDNARAYGGRSFWPGIANSVNTQVNAQGFLVGSSHFAASHKQFGGTISAPGRGPMSRGRRNLSIPLDGAKGKTPSDFQNLWCLKSKKGNLFLVRNKNKKSALELLFVLKKEVTQKAYPWFPLKDEAKTEIKRGIDIWRKQNAKGTN